MQRELAVARLQTEFVAAVSHEFRTPLTALRHVTDLLEESDDVPVERRRQFYQTLGRNTDRLQRLVESLLDFSRMESGRQPYDLRIIDVVALVEPVVADFQRDAAGAAVVVLRVAPDAPRRVRADPVSLSTAIWNLLDNAVKYSPAGAVVEVDVVPHSSGVAIMVRDRGIGIPDGEQRDVFERFVRGADAGVRGVPGTGLGLALVQHIVAAHGGSIALESVHGAGSTFTIALPEASCRES
jgi:two-component system sensor histidine kinase SenX3